MRQAHRACWRASRLTAAVPRETITSSHRPLRVFRIHRHSAEPDFRFLPAELAGNRGRHRSTDKIGRTKNSETHPVAVAVFPGSRDTHKYSKALASGQLLRCS